MSTTQGSSQSISRRQMLKGMGLTGVGLALAACAPGAAPAGDSGGAASGEPTEIVYHYRTTLDELYQSLADGFHEAQGDVKVKLEATPPGDYNQKLSTLAAAGDLGDTYWANVFGPLYPFGSAGIALDIGPLLEADTELGADDFFDVFLQQSSWDGTLIGLPMSGHPGWTTIYCNEDRFAEVGQDFPAWEWTWEKEFVEMAQNLHKGDDDGDGVADMFGFEFQYAVQNTYTFIRCWGGDWIDESNTNSTLLNEEVLEAISFQRSFVENGLSPRADEVVDNMFGNGLSSSWSNGIWQYNRLPNIIEDKFAFDGYPAPSGPAGRSSFIGCDTFCINGNKSETVDASYAWGKWLTTTDALIEAFQFGTPTPARKEGWENEIFTADPTMIAVRDWIAEASSWSVPANARAIEFRSAFNQQITAVLDPNNDFMAEMESLNTAVQGVLDKPPI